MSKWIFEPIWDWKYRKGALDKDVDYRVIGIRTLFYKIKEKIKECKYKHLELGKVDFEGNPFENSFKVKGISWGISWQTDRYLAIIIRDYIRFHVTNTPAIGNCVIKDNPEGIPYEDFLFDRVHNDVDYYVRWKELALRVADEFDELRIMIEKADNSNYSREKLQETIDKAFKDLAYIYQDLGW